jgi:hypothetical protein
MFKPTARRQRSRRYPSEKPNQPPTSAVVTTTVTASGGGTRLRDSQRGLLDSRTTSFLALGKEAAQAPTDASQEPRVTQGTNRNVQRGRETDLYGELAQVLWPSSLAEAVGGVGTARPWTPEMSLEGLSGSRALGIPTRAAPSLSAGARCRSVSREVSPSSLLENMEGADGVRWPQPCHGLDGSSSSHWMEGALATMTSRADATMAVPISSEVVYGDEKDQVDVNPTGADGEKKHTVGEPNQVRESNGLQRIWGPVGPSSRDTPTSRDSSPLHQLLSDAGLDSRVETGSTISAGLQFNRQSPFSRYDSPLRQPIFVEWSTGNTSTIPETNTAWQALTSEAGAIHDISPSSRLVTPDIVAWATEGPSTASLDIPSQDAFLRTADSPKPMKTEPTPGSRDLAAKMESISGNLDDQSTPAKPTHRVPWSAGQTNKSQASTLAETSETTDIESLVSEVQRLVKRLCPEDRRIVQQCVLLLAQHKRTAESIQNHAIKRPSRSIAANPSSSFIEAAETLILRLFFQSDTRENLEIGPTANAEIRHNSSAKECH